MCLASSRHVVGAHGVKILSCPKDKEDAGGVAGGQEEGAY